jgi:hypothetical protein
MRSLILAILIFFNTSVFGQGIIIGTTDTVLVQSDVVKIFLFENYMFSDGSRIKMVVLPRDHITTRIFSYKLGITPNRFFDRAENSFSSGKLNMLIVAENDKAAVKYLLKTDGVIGYVQDYYGDSISTMPNIIKFR